MEYSRTSWNHLEESFVQSQKTLEWSRKIWEDIFLQGKKTAFSIDKYMYKYGCSGVLANQSFNQKRLPLYD
jgi:hypothetical protein